MRAVVRPFGRAFGRAGAPVHLPTVGALTVAVLAVAASGPAIAYAAAPALAIAFWRNALASGALIPVAALRRHDELRQLAGVRRRTGLYAVLAGLALAVHFACWVPSTKLTTVAASTALVATQPVWQGLIAVGQGRRLPAMTWVGIAVSVGAAVALTGAGVGEGPAVVAGDLLALAGAVGGAAYTALGEHVRVGFSTTAYTAVCYPVCALSLLAVCLIAGVPLSGYPASAWLAVVAITVGPQLLGHSLFNFSLRRVSATTVSVVILLEVPGAALIGWLWLGQVPRPATWPGMLLLLAGIAIVVLAGSAAARRGSADAPRDPLDHEAGAPPPPRS